MNEETKVFIIDRDAPPPLKSKDTLLVRFSPLKSADHFSAAWDNTAAVYEVENATNNHAYTVEFYVSKTLELLLATCDCPARVRCKHIAAAWDVHAKAETAGFFPKIKLKEDYL